MKCKNKYHQLCYWYLGEAEKALKEKRYTQASEKLWGVTAQMLKAIAQKNGWKHKSHKALWDIAINLSRHYNDPSIGTLFGLASALHQNFYENHMPPRAVRRAVKRIKYFVRKIEKLL